MTKEQKARYEGVERLRDILKRVLDGRKFMLDCGHITIYNGKKMKLICSQCGY